MLPKFKEFLARVKSGEEKTTLEWGRELYPNVTDKTNLRRAMLELYRSLHKRGELVFPIKYGTGKNAVWIVKWCNKDETLLSKAFNVRVSAGAEANIISSMQLAERYVFAFPKSRQKVIDRAKDLIHLALEQEKHLLGIKYEPAKTLGHFED